MDELTLQHKKVWVLGLLFNCPLGNAKEDCPIKEIRKLSLIEREKTGEAMDEPQLDSIISHHQKCVKETGNA